MAPTGRRGWPLSGRPGDQKNLSMDPTHFRSEGIRGSALTACAAGFPLRGNAEPFRTAHAPRAGRDETAAPSLFGPVSSALESLAEPCARNRIVLLSPASARSSSPVGRLPARSTPVWPHPKIVLSAARLGSRAPRCLRRDRSRLLVQLPQEHQEDFGHSDRGARRLAGSPGSGRAGWVATSGQRCEGGDAVALVAEGLGGVGDGLALGCARYAGACGVSRAAHSPHSSPSPGAASRLVSQGVPATARERAGGLGGVGDGLAIWGSRPGWLGPVG